MDLGGVKKNWCQRKIIQWSLLKHSLEDFIHHGGYEDSCDGILQ